MPRPSDWDAIGLGGDPTPGDPEQIGQLAEVLQKLGGKAREIFNAIESVMNTNNDSVFVGATADALRGKVDGRLRGHVEDVANAFETSAQALRDWRGVVEEQQRKADAALNAGRGLAEDDPDRETQKGIAEQAGRDQSDQASTYAGRINGVSDIQLPISECEAFWEAFKWLAIILIIPALIFGGPIALLALGVNLALFIKTIVDVANGDATFLDLFLAGLGLIAPTTKALPIFSILKGIAKGIGAGVKGIANTFRTVFSKDFLFNSLLVGLKGMPMLANLAIKETGLFVVSNIRNFAITTGQFVGRFDKIALGAFNSFKSGITTFRPGSILTGFQTAWKGLTTSKFGQFVSAHFGGLQWTRMILPVAADEIRAFKALGLSNFQAFTQALKVGVVGRGVFAQNVFGLPTVGAIGRGIGAIPIETGAGAGAGKTSFLQQLIKPEIRIPSVHINSIGLATEGGFKGGQVFHAIDELHLAPMQNIGGTKIGVSVHTPTTVTTGGVHIPATAGTPSAVNVITNIPSPHIGTPATSGTNGINGLVQGLPNQGQIGTPVLNGVNHAIPAPVNGTTVTPHINGTQIAQPVNANVGSLHISTPGTTSISDLVGSGLRNNPPTISSHFATTIGEGTSHGFQANHIRLSIDEIVNLPTSSAHGGTHAVSTPTVDRVNAALDLLTGGPANLKVGAPGNLHVDTPTVGGAQNVAAPPAAHVQPVGVPKSDVPVQPALQTGGTPGVPNSPGVPGAGSGGHSFTPGKTEIPLTGLPDHPGVVVKVERFEGGVTQFNLHGGGPNGRLDPLSGGHVRFTDTSTGTTTRFDSSGIVVDQGVRLTRADGLPRIDDRVLIKQPDGQFRVTSLDGHVVPEHLNVRQLDTGGVQILGKDGASWHYSANGKLEGQNATSSWNSDAAAKAGVFRKPGDTDAAVNARMDDFTSVQRAQQNVDVAHENVAIHGERADGPSTAPSVGEQVHLDLHAAQNDLAAATNAFEGKHGVSADGLQQQLDTVVLDSLKERPRLLGGGGRTYDLPGNAGVHFQVSGSKVVMDGPGAEAFTPVVTGRSLTISGADGHTWSYRLGFGGSANLVGESFPLKGGLFGGHSVALEGKLGSLDHGLVVDGAGKQWPAKLVDDSLVVGSPQGPMRYDLDGTFRTTDVTATGHLPAPVTPSHLTGTDAVRWSAQVDLARTHLTAASSDKAVEAVMRDVVGGSFTSKRGFEGFVKPSALEGDQLIANVRRFDSVTKDLLFKGPTDNITVYRGVSMDPLSAKADSFVERLPISTSNSLEFQHVWAKNGVQSNRVVFEIDVPPAHGKLVMAYPDRYDFSGQAKAWNQSQAEITLSPTTLVRTGPDRMVGDLRIVPVRAEQIPAERFDEVIRAQWPGMSSDVAFTDFVKSFELDNLRKFAGLEDVASRSVTSADGLMHTVHVTKPRFSGEVTITVLRNEQADSVRVTVAVDGVNKFDRSWSRQQFATLATDLRGHVLHNNEETFANLARPAHWPKASGAEALRLAWESDLAAKTAVFRVGDETDAVVNAKMADFGAIQKAQAKVDAALDDVALHGHRADGPSTGHTVGDQAHLNLRTAQADLQAATTTFESKYGLQVADIQAQLDTLTTQSLKNRPRLPGGMDGRTAPAPAGTGHAAPAPGTTGHGAPPPPPPPPPGVGHAAPPAPPPPVGTGHVGGGRTGPAPERTQQTAAPGFRKEFDGASYGSESELGGFVVAMPEGTNRTFAFVKEVGSDDPLIMVTKDMSNGVYRNPDNLPQASGGNWRTHTVELVSYPAKVGDNAGIAVRDEATQFLLDVFKGRISLANHRPMEPVISPDGRFALQITNDRHVLASGNGMHLDEPGSVTMPPGGQQLTVGVKATDFSGAASNDLRLLDNPWYQPEFAADDALRAVSHQLDNPQQVENAYTYLKSIMSFTAKQVDKHGIPIGDYPGKAPYRGLTDPAVKNDWAVLPRTRPNIVLESLTGPDRAATLKLLRETPPVGDAAIWKEVRQYLLGGGEVAGHGINNATIAGEKALLFEFRTVPDGLKHLVPKQAAPVVNVTDTLAGLGPRRADVVRQLDTVLSDPANRADFSSWFGELKPNLAGRPPEKLIGIASAAQKAEWLMTHRPVAWQGLVQEPVVVNMVHTVHTPPPPLRQHQLTGAFDNHTVVRPTGARPHITGPDARFFEVQDFGANGFRVIGPDGQTQRFGADGAKLGEGLVLRDPRVTRFTEGTHLVDAQGTTIPNVRVFNVQGGGVRIVGPHGQMQRYGADGAHLANGTALNDPFHLRGSFFTEPDGAGGLRAVDLNGTPLPHATVEHLPNGQFRVADNALGDVRWHGQDGLYRGSGIRVADPAHPGQVFLYHQLGREPVLLDNTGAQLPGTVTTFEGGFRVTEANGIARTFDDAGIYVDRRIPLGGGPNPQQLVIHDVDNHLTLHDPGGAGRTVEHVQGGGYRVVDGGNYYVYDGNGTFLAHGHTVNLPGENGFLEIAGTTGRRLDGNYQPLPGRTVTFDAATGEITVTRAGGHDVFDQQGVVLREVTDLDGHGLGAGTTRVTRDQNGVVTLTDRNGVAVPTPHRVTIDQHGGVRLEIDVPGSPRNGEFHVFSRDGHLTEQGFPVVRNGRPTEFTYVVNRTDNTWRRVDQAHQNGTGSFQHGKVDIVGLDNGRIRLQSSTAKEVEVFERRWLPDNTILDSFRRTDTLGYGAFDRRTTWATYDANGALTNWGKRHFDTGGSAWRDYDHHGNSVRDYQQGLQKYANPIAEQPTPLGKADKEITGHVLAIKDGRAWTWHRYDAQGVHIADGNRTLERIGEGWTDMVRVMEDGNEVTRVAQQKWGTWHGPDTARQYQEFKLEAGAAHPTRSGEFEVRSPQLKSVGKGELLDNGALLKTVRQGDQRPPAWVRQNFLDNPPTVGSVAHISGDNRFQIFRWDTSGEGIAGGRGVRYVGADESVVDVNLNGEFVRSKGTLHDGTELKVGDHATTPGTAHPNSTTPWTAGDVNGWRVFDNNNGWQDVAEVAGLQGWTVVRESHPGGAVREYPRPADRNIWVQRDAHGNLVGSSHQTPTPVGGNHRYVVATGAADSSRWRWQELDHHGVQLAGREGDRFHFKGSGDERISWDDSFRDFDAAGNLIRDRHLLDEGRYVESWQDGNGWKVGEFDKTGVEVAGSTRLDRQWLAADGTWQQNWTAGGQHFRDSLPPNGQVPAQVLRETPTHVGDGRPIRVREYQLDNGRTDLRQWKEFDFDKVVRERVASGNNFLETDKIHGQWKLYDQQGGVIGERSDNGLVFELRDGRLTLTGNEFDFRGALTEYRGWNSRIGDAQRQPWLMQSDWTLADKTLTPGGNAFREANYAPFSRLLTQKVLLQVGTEFLLDYAASLMILGIVAEAQNKPFTGDDALKALMNGAVGATLKTVAGAALTESKLGGSLRTLKQSMGNLDGGKLITKRPNNNDATWGVEWAGNTSPVRWRGGIFDYSLNMMLLPLTGFVNGTMNAAIFGVPNADGKTVKLSGWEAVGEGGIAVLSGYAIANSLGLVKLIGGNFGAGRFFQKGGVADIVLTMPLRLFEKGVGGVFLAPAIRASINPSWYQVPLTLPPVEGAP
ncbi:actin cross-linking domain-containing toxin [Kribbella sp. NPDC003557]|uniref:actin cross-linking domain-containing toxin n=1 Tax=Kribbella sp. NPDC003557 TaxID=3154449 RepID=UPI0033A776F2